MRDVNASTGSARVLVQELVRHGVRHVVLAPGSRSAPLAFALSAAAGRGELRLHVRIDERVAAFTALGLARVSGPVAVVTTSGTATANLHPAVLEAAHGNVPLVILTADRPHELRGTGANQTTDQVRLFGSAVRHFADVPAPVGRAGEDIDLRNLLARAFAAATGQRTSDPGPIHLNLAYREPLVPDDLADGLAPPAGGELDATGATAVEGTRMGGELVIDDDRLTVVVAGDRAGLPARTLAEAGAFPLLAEPSSGARAGANAVGPYRLLLDHPRLGRRVERVVVFGNATLSRPVSTLLARADLEVVVVAGERANWPDAGRQADRVVSSVRCGLAETTDWLDAWQRAAKIATQAIDGTLAEVPLCGPVVAREVWAALRPVDILVVSSSNPVRDLDLAGAPFHHVGSDTIPTVLANRGLAGIDGTISTASGVALASGRLVRVLLGDLAFLHDSGGLLVGPLEERPDLQIIVINDDGGGIFSLLEYGDPALTAHVERVFGTPHGADLAAVSAGFGMRHTEIDRLDDLRAALAEPSGREVIEIRANRGEVRGLHARIRSAVTEALDR